MNLSVLICTFNRANSLRTTLESVRDLSVPEDFPWELVVVDNNSSDDTRDVVEEFIALSGVECRYVFERKQGLSHARNRGIREARGGIIAFTDDDVLLDGKWLMNLWGAFENGKVACIGGKILPLWEKPPPRWLRGELLNFLALQDLGEERIALDRPVIWGANLAVRSAMFSKYGMFDTRLGHTEGKLYGGEETDFVRHLIDRKETVLYCPDVLVHHCIPGNRLRKSYFRKWVFDKGELKGIGMGDHPKRTLFGVPYYVYRETGMDFLRYLRKQIVSPGDAFREQLLFILGVGTIAGRWKHRNSNSKVV